MVMDGTAGAAPDLLRARQIVEGLSEGFVALDAEWRIVDCNAVAERFLGAERAEFVGRPLAEVLGAGANGPFAQIAQRIAAGGPPEQAEILYTGRGQRRLLLVQVFPLHDGVGAVWRDITSLRTAERRLANSAARYRELADASPAAAWLSRADGRLEFINQAMADAVGRERKDLLGGGWQEAIDPRDRPRLEAASREASTRRAPFHYEGRFRRPDGSLRIIELHGRPRFDGAGGFRGYAGMAMDVTEARLAEQRQQLLIDELNHRVKNTLATVQSLVRHTLRHAGAPRELDALLTDRLMALSAAHDVLTREKWQGAGLADIVHGALAPYLGLGRIAVAGPDAWVAPHVAVALSMALHELATNALKHGSLSSDAGRVSLSWVEAERGVDLEWRESDGPRIASPERTGFGSRLLGRALASEFGSAADIAYAPDGVVCRFRVPTISADHIAPAAAR